MNEFVNEVNATLAKYKDVLNEDEKPENFIVTYLKPKVKKYGHFSSYDKKSNLELKTEKLGHLFNKRRIFWWLSCKYPQNVFSKEDVEKCYNIFSLFLKKTNTIDGDVGYKDYYYSRWFNNYGIFTESRKEVLDNLLSQDEIRIMCFNVDEQQFNANYVDTYNMTLEEKKNKLHKDYLTFSMNDMKDDWAYNFAIKYLETIPDFQRTYDMFHKHFKLPIDIINHISGFLNTESPSSPHLLNI